MKKSTSVGDIAEDDRRVAAKEEAKDLDLSPFEREKAVKDMAMQGLTCERIVALSQSLILGKVVKPSHTVGMKYGEDPALSEKSKQMRKAGKRMLADVIKSKHRAWVHVPGLDDRIEALLLPQAMPAALSVGRSST